MYLNVRKFAQILTKGFETKKIKSEIPKCDSDSLVKMSLK